MEFARWTEDLVTGHPQVDTQHRRWYALVNELHEAIVAGRGDEVLGAALRAVYDYTDFHFSAEEGLMQAHHYPAFGSHRATHLALKRQVKDLIERNATRKVLPLTVGLFLGNWLRDHIETVDRRFIEWERAAAR
ncbi:MAG: hypothetical protein CVU56_28830 [Deltaproteobacteria bacterium HGW-Deltaproteobacteria-14]|jgi:hemerythrin|nr:MAG: hypothetical protein CVU56_28830 [Deltaproteobacteria bacterium HGW-Deltaproteobacteria-14]